MFLGKDRLNRERKTIKAMIALYCRAHHQPTADLCDQCRNLFDYAMQRIDKCPFRDDKPTCEKCPVHCYKPAMREEVHKVMRYSGPRMLLHHPIMVLMHYVDGRASGKDE
ncbi:MAG: nitrous oxide-stimulated promoter family protein [Nitrospirota bacterium]|nr:nitrous oxide-stimulated promoter family protein [Nitrospirota bacterium]